MLELHRVLRPGGRLVIVEPDRSRSAIDADDADLAELLTAQPDRSAANFRSGRRVRSHAVLAGFVEVEVEAEAQTVTDLDEYRATARRTIAIRLTDVVADGIIDRERADTFLAEQDTRATQGRFQVTLLTYVLAAAKRAGSSNGGRVARGRSSQRARVDIADAGAILGTCASTPA